MQWLVLSITILAVIWGWKNPRYLLPLLILALPLEISREWFPHLSVLDKLGQFVGVIYFGRVMTLTVIAYFLWSLIHAQAATIYQRNSRNRLVEILRAPEFLALLLYILWGALSLLWSVDRTATLVGVARLGLLSLLALAVHDLIKKHDSYSVIPFSFSAVSSALAVVGIYEMLSKNLLWLHEIYGTIDRYNATFVDANIYARFLLLGIFATLFLLIGATTWNYRLAGLLALALQLVALVGTGSRASWLALLAIALCIALMIPRRSVILTLIIAGLIVATGVVLTPEYYQRVVEIQQNFSSAMLQRGYLIYCGLEMFRENPVLGIGLQGFQKMMLTRFSDWIHNGVSLSHTAVITTAAELGIIGLGLTGVFLLSIYSKIPRALRSLKRRTHDNIFLQNSNHTILAVLAITAIFITAQSEGRFFEDPYLWIFIGYLSAIRDYEEVS